MDNGIDRGDEVAEQVVADTKPADTAEDTSAAKAGDAPTGDDVSDKLDTEGEETAEEKAEREKAEDEARRKASIRIPKARFDEAQARAREREQTLLEEIERLKGSKQTTDVQRAVGEVREQITTLQDKYEDLILDGKKDEARAVRRQVEALRDELAEFQTTVKTDAARRGAIDELSYNAQLASIESTYEVLNPENPNFDADKTDEVSTLVEAFVKSGMKRTDALSKAVKYVLGAPPQQRVADAASTLAAERARKAREKAAEANTKQPPNGSGVGNDSDKAGGGAGIAGIDIMRLSQEKFTKLDEDTLAKLRGDEV